MRIPIAVLIVLLAGSLSIHSLSAGRSSSSDVEYADDHLIVCFARQAPVPADVRVSAPMAAFVNPVLRDLKLRASLMEVERLIPLGGAVQSSRSPDRPTLAPPPPAVQAAARLFRKYGLDRLFLLRFARPIDPQRLAEKLMRQYPDIVEYAEPDYIRHLTIIPNDRLFRFQWHLKHRIADVSRRADIRAPEAWDITTGDPDVVIAVIDSGLDLTHPDMEGKLFVNPGEIPNNRRDDDGNGFVDDVSGWDFMRRDPQPDDENGHGTWMSSIAAAATNNARDVAGVSWGSRVLPLKVADASGSVFVSLEVQAIAYATMMAAHGVRVINMSFGGSGRSRSVEQALRAAGEAGIIAMAAAGNGGEDGIGDDNDSAAFYPANYSLTLENVVSVASTDRFNRLSRFSNFGRQSVDVGAPGEGIFGLTVRDASAELGSADGILSGLGTSPATAITSGVAALIYSAFPEITPAQVKARLRGCVDRFDTLLDTTFSGGRINAERALEDDRIPPAPITDFHVVEGSSPLTLAWTATGDDGREGQATFYDVRFLTAPITPSNLRFAQRIEDVRFPQPAGTPETLTVPEGLLPRTYYFLIRVFDNVGHMAESNQLEVTISP